MQDHEKEFSRRWTRDNMMIGHSVADRFRDVRRPKHNFRITIGNYYFRYLIQVGTESMGKRRLQLRQRRLLDKGWYYYFLDINDKFSYEMLKNKIVGIRNGPNYKTWDRIRNPNVINPRRIPLPWTFELNNPPPKPTVIRRQK